MNTTNPQRRNVFTFLTGKPSTMIDHAYTPMFYETVQWMCREIGRVKSDELMSDVFWDYYGPNPLDLNDIIEKHRIRRHQVYNKLNKMRELVNLDEQFSDIKAELHANMENKTVRLGEYQLLEKEISEIELKYGLLEDQLKELTERKVKIQSRLDKLNDSSLID